MRKILIVCVYMGWRMSRIKDIRELISEIDAFLVDISLTYKNAEVDFSIDCLPKVKVKNALENLRSILDYSALDIYEFLYPGKAPKIYFPYKENKLSFDEAINKIFKKIEILNVDVYKAVESIQPHVFGSDTLVELCRFTNDNKHQNLTPQTKVAEPVVRNIGGLVAFVRGGGVVNFHSSTFNGQPIGKSSFVKISANMSDEEILEQLNPDLSISITRIGGRVQFKLNNSDHDVLEFLSECRFMVFGFVEKLYAIIT